MTDETPDEALLERAVLDDSSTVLSARRELDALSLEVLTAPGLPVVEVTVLRDFLDSPRWRAAVPADGRLRGRGRWFRSEP